jgi:hypothetical protein
MQIGFEMIILGWATPIFRFGIIADWIFIDAF